MPALTLRLLTDCSGKRLNKVLPGTAAANSQEQVGPGRRAGQSRAPLVSLPPTIVVSPTRLSLALVWAFSVYTFSSNILHFVLVSLAPH